ncbi:MAG: hypothetical protein IJK23_06610 [Clostridia bacterium]|nr:hypothetical protein [Clostridia bacterium]
MEKNMIDERNGWEYELIGDMYYPTGRVLKDGRLQPETVDDNNEPEKETPIGVWGQRHAAFLRNHQRSVYNELKMSISKCRFSPIENVGF